MQMTYEDLVRPLSNTSSSVCEQVIAIKPVQRMLRFKKDEWNRYFSQYTGISVRIEADVELVASNNNIRKLELCGAVLDKLGLKKGDHLCVTKQGNRFFLKALHTDTAEALCPGNYVIDSFEPTTVYRHCCSNTQFPTAEDLDELVSAMGMFEHNPVTPFRTMKGMTGILARHSFAGGLTPADIEWIDNYTEQVSERQEKNGSWQNAVAETAFQITRLLDLGRSPDTPCIIKAIDWLLARPSPVGFPGLFMSDDPFVEKFNDWKKPGAKGQKGRKTPVRIVEEYRRARDLLGAPETYCEARFSWLNGLVIGTLSRCGLHHHERVIRGINTMLYLSNDGGWCGCHYFYACDSNFIESRDTPVDFNRFAPHKAEGDFSPCWYLTPDILNDWTCENNFVIQEPYTENETILSRAVDNTGDCGRVIHWGLSRHPEYAGSAMETIFALNCIKHQTAAGRWRGSYLSFMFNMLTTCKHPLATFALLRSMPRLIQGQGEDGLWDERSADCCFNMSPNCEEPLPPEVSSYLILKALHAHDLLHISQ